jgi:hypothetical protein
MYTYRIVVCSVRVIVWIESLERFVHDGYEPQGDIVHRQFFVPRPQAAILLVPPHYPLHDVPPSVGCFVKLLVPRLIRARWDHVLNVPLGTPPPDARVTIPFIPCQPARPTTFPAPTVNESPRHGRLKGFTLVRLPGRDVDGDDEAVGLTHQMDLGPVAAPRATERMVLRLLQLRLFPPAQLLASPRLFFSPQRQPCWPESRSHRCTTSHGQSGLGHPIGRGGKWPHGSKCHPPASD